MFETEIISEDAVNYNLLFCHACLSSNRTLMPVGDLLDIYLKICDNSLMNLTSQVNVCWECLALLKKVQTFRKKVGNAQKILQNCIKKQAPLEDNLSNLALSSIETTNFISLGTRDPCNDDIDKCTSTEGSFIEKPDREESHDELMIQIQDVRGQCDILHEEPTLGFSTSAGEVTIEVEHLETPEDEEARRHRRWKRAIMHVFNRICRHRHAYIFSKPVTDDQAPLYSAIVRRPTDLSAIRKGIRGGSIRTTAELTRALLLMFSNALMYNSSHHFIYQWTLEFREETLRELSIPGDADQARRPASLSDSFNELQKIPLPRTRGASVHHSVELRTPAGAHEPVSARATDHTLENHKQTNDKPASRARRASVDRPKPAENQKPARARRPSVYYTDFILVENKKPQRARRASMYHPEPKPVENQKPKRGRRASMYHPEPKQVENQKPRRGRRASMYHPEPKPAENQKPQRARRASMYYPEPKPAENQKPQRARRASMYHPEPKPVEDQKPPSGRRRASLHHSAEHHILAENQKPATENPRKRAKSDWPSVEDKYLIAKKYKNSVGVLL